MAQETSLCASRVLPGTGVTSLPEEIPTERQLLERVRSGDREAYQGIVLRYMQAAYYIALGFVHNQQDALDISQDAFVRAFRKIRQYDPQKRFFPWFYRLLKNLCLDHIKKHRRRREIPLEDVQVFKEEKDNRELKEVLWKGIEELPFDQREVIILRYFRQCSYQEIAEVTGKPLGTVMSSLFYAKKKLKESIKKYWYSD